MYYGLNGDAIYMVDHNLGLGYIEVPAGQTTAQTTFNTLNNTMDSNDNDLDVYITHTNQPDYLAGNNARIRTLVTGGRTYTQLKLNDNIACANFGAAGTAINHLHQVNAARF